MTTCERCQETLIDHPESPRRPVPVIYGETDMTICYQCAVELTCLIAAWLDSEPMDDPHKEDKRTWLPGVGLAYDSGQDEPKKVEKM